MRRILRRRPPAPHTATASGNRTAAVPEPSGAPGAALTSWQAEELAAAQAFIAREWAAHLHDTVHVHEDDWDAGEAIATRIAAMRAGVGLPRTAPCLWCRYCLADEAREGMASRRIRLEARREGTA